MLENLSEQIRECHWQAQECARRAREHTDPKARQDYLDFERRWLRLAASYEFAERMQCFMSKPSKSQEAAE